MGTLTDLAEVAQRLAKLHARRDQLIVKARTEGHSLRTIADAANLSHGGVAKIETR